MVKIEHVFYIFRGLTEIFGKKNINEEKKKYDFEIKGNSIAICFTDLNRIVYLKLTDSGLKVDIKNFIRKNPDITVSLTSDTLMNVIDGRIKLVDNDNKPYFEDFDIYDAWRWGYIVTDGPGSTNAGRKALDIIGDNIGELQEKVRVIRGD